MQKCLRRTKKSLTDEEKQLVINAFDKMREAIEMITKQFAS